MHGWTCLLAAGIVRLRTADSRLTAALVQVRGGHMLFLFAHKQRPVWNVPVRVARRLGAETLGNVAEFQESCDSLCPVLASSPLVAIFQRFVAQAITATGFDRP